MSKYVITIARGYGSGGRTIGKMLAEELGIPIMTVSFYGLPQMTVVLMRSYLPRLMRS